MTTCVATVCDDGKAIVLVADKMVGVGFIESELEITKMRPIHKDWWMLFAGDDISPVFDIVDKARNKIGKGPTATIEEVQEAVRLAFEEKRQEEAVTLFLTPIGWDMERFHKEGSALLPDFAQIKDKIADYRIGIELLVAGFDAGKGYVFSLYGHGEKPGITNRRDIPGFDAIGTGSTGATYMMYYRDCSPKMTIREAVYYSLEGKYFGEQAGGVSESTDLFIARPGCELLQLNDEETIEKKLIPICRALSPNPMRRRDRDVINKLSELGALPLIEEPKKKSKSLAPKGK